MIDISISVEGTEEIIAKLTKLQRSLRDFSGAFNRIGGFMFDTAVEEAPEYTGALIGSHRMKSTNMQATVKAGGAGRRSHGGGIYVAKQHNGGYATGMYGPHKVGPNPWLDRTLIKSEPFAVQIIEAEVDTKIKEAGL